ncbi:MAG: site-2 protease family protein [Proteobacteria bacterium ST_bin12]|nr:MAG: site-2 protease family protein [Proteobacteria bacterium ST_bin12]
MDFFSLLSVLQSLTTVQRIAVTAIPMILAITVHEAAHGYAARHFGDMTAHHLGRISLNPIRHIDLVGTVIVPSITMLVGGIFFGWAKPVPVNFMKLRHPKRDMLWVAAAGPGANLAMAILWAIAMQFARFLPEYAAVPFALMGVAGILTNTILMVLNLLPLPPLDGGRIAVSLLPNNLAIKYAQIERYGFIILILLLVTHILDKIMWPFVMFTLQSISAVFF